MAFIIPKTPESTQDLSLSNSTDKNESADNSVTSQLYLKSSSTHKRYQSLDKEIVLRRIRYHKSMNKVRNTLHSLLGSSPPDSPLSDYYEQKWLELGDTFSSP